MSNDHYETTAGSESLTPVPPPAGPNYPHHQPYPGRPAAAPPGTSAGELAGITGEVSPDSQALVWGIVASEHGAALLGLLTQQHEQAEAGTVPTADDALKLMRGITYHRDSHAVADKVAGMWALINSTTMPSEWQDDDDATGQDGEAG
jgi:hypothetical protein